MSVTTFTQPLPPSALRIFSKCSGQLPREGGADASGSRRALIRSPLTGELSNVGETEGVISASSFFGNCTS